MTKEKQNQEKAMKRIFIEKITINMGVGEPGEKMEKAKKLLGWITGITPIETKAKKRIPKFNIRPGLPIGCKVTIRGKTEELLKTLLTGVDNTLKERNFDNTGNFSFGIPEYIDIPKFQYDPDIGILGFEVSVTLARPGYRIKNRKTRKAKIGKFHLITKQESIKFIMEKFNVEVK